MKLRDKETGEIGRLKESNCDEYEYLVVIDGNPQVCRYYHTLKEVTDNYEDYEEPKGCWIINILGVVEYTHFRNEVEAELLKEVGNYFETQKEAEKAAEKRKAWTRLKDKGFRFKDWELKNGHKIFFGLDDKSFNAGWLDEEIAKDLDLLFGGEE